MEMASKLFKKPKLLIEFLEICKTNEYFSAVAVENLVKNITFLKHASNLHSNIERQWSFKSKDIENSLKTYPNDDFSDYGQQLSLLEKYSIVRKRDRLAKTVPFGLIEILENQQINLNSDENRSDEGNISIELATGGRLLTCSYLVNDKQSQEYFYRIQRLRKIWWMKYAANPGRFSISEVKQNDENDSKSISIKATYPFGNIDIEDIDLLPLKYEPTDELKNKNSAPTKVIRTKTVSEIATIESVLDAIDAGDFGEMCFHRKIAPYQCAICSIVRDSSNLIELKDLSKYISMLLQRSNITVLNSKDFQFCHQSDLERKHNEMDAIGVPYSIVLNDESLQAGFMKLRNRDTTLSETIHISHINDYLPKIFQS